LHLETGSVCPLLAYARAGGATSETTSASTQILLRFVCLRIVLIVPRETEFTTKRIFRKR